MPAQAGVAPATTVIVQDKTAAYPVRKYPVKGKYHTMKFSEGETLVVVLFGRSSNDDDEMDCVDPMVHVQNWTRDMDVNETTSTWFPKRYSMCHLEFQNALANAKEKKEALAACQADTTPETFYMGELEDGVPDGFGIMVYQDKMVYEGGWTNGRCTVNWGGIKGTKGLSLYGLMERAATVFKLVWRTVRLG
jgi:hypothetical protein